MERQGATGLSPSPTSNLHPMADFRQQLHAGVCSRTELSAGRPTPTECQALAQDMVDRAITSTSRLPIARLRRTRAPQTIGRVATPCRLGGSQWQRFLEITS